MSSFRVVFFIAVFQPSHLVHCHTHIYLQNNFSFLVKIANYLHLSNDLLICYVLTGQCRSEMDEKLLNILWFLRYPSFDTET